MPADHCVFVIGIDVSTKIFFHPLDTRPPLSDILMDVIRCVFMVKASDFRLIFSHLEGSSDEFFFFLFLLEGPSAHESIFYFLPHNLLGSNT